MSEEISKGWTKTQESGIFIRTKIHKDGKTKQRTIKIKPNKKKVNEQKDDELEVKKPNKKKANCVACECAKILCIF